MPDPNRPRNFLVATLRMLTAGWVFAAILFVMITVHEITRGGFDSLILDQLVLLRFPVYYTFTFVLLGGSLLTGLANAMLASGKRRYLFAFSLILLAVITLVVDYIFVYCELVKMLLPLGSPRPQWFRSYHRSTEVMNSVAMLLVLIASLLLQRNPSVQSTDQL
ncbi:MAG: hypothetical protein KDA78_04295 [Planctomycetaceae bacterium]|nr:hypothetical protein [Planctomycetaceae bacterium]